MHLNYKNPVIRDNWPLEDDLYILLYIRHGSDWHLISRRLNLNLNEKLCFRYEDKCNKTPFIKLSRDFLLKWFFWNYLSIQLHRPFSFKIVKIQNDVVKIKSISAWSVHHWLVLFTPAQNYPYRIHHATQPLLFYLCRAHWAAYSVCSIEMVCFLALFISV